MDAAEALYELQKLDAQIARDTAALEAERARMQEPAAVRQARARIAGLEQETVGLQRQQRATEQEAQAVAAKKDEVHRKLYGGTVSVPRELAALGNEENALAVSLSQVEDRELELMASSEAIETQLAEARRQLQAELEQWGEAGRSAGAHIERLQAEVEELKGQREARAAGISRGNLALYERLRPRKANRPVALVQNSACQACGVNLPSRDVQRARGADPPHVCENCGRILYVP